MNMLQSHLKVNHELASSELNRQECCITQSVQRVSERENIAAESPKNKVHLLQITENSLFHLRGDDEDTSCTLFNPTGDRKYFYPTLFDI